MCFSSINTINPELSTETLPIKKHDYQDSVFLVLQIPMNSVPACEYTMEPRGFVIFSSFTPHSQDKTSSFLVFSLLE